MAAPIPLRADYNSESIRAVALASCDAGQTRRLLALALIDQAASRSDAARFAGVMLQIVRDWVLKFNVNGPDGLIDRKAPGSPSILTPAQWQKVAPSKNRALLPGFMFNPARAGWLERVMRGQAGFWDLDERYQRLSAFGDPLETLNTIIPCSVFVPALEGALARPDRSKGGRPPFAPVLMFKVLVLQAL